MDTLLRRRRLVCFSPEPAAAAGPKGVVVVGAADALEVADVVVDLLPSSTMTLLKRRNNFVDSKKSLNDRLAITK